MALSLGKLVLLAPCLAGALYTADSGSKLTVQPLRLVRLLNSVYGADHLLLFGREEEPDQLMSTLLAFDQAVALETELGGSASAQSRGVFGDIGLTGKLLTRTDFFEAAARQSYGPWELAQCARRAESVADAMAQHLAERRGQSKGEAAQGCGLQPQCVVLGGDAAEAQEVGAVGMRDLGAQTPAAPSSVRLTAQLATTLLCSRSDGAGSGSSGGKADGGGGGGGGSGSGAQGEAAPLPIPLGGAADAVLLARHAAARGGALPILVSPALWAMRAMPPSRLPESIAEQDCTIEACELP